MLEKQAHADAFFARSANKLDFGNWSEQEKMALSCRVLASEGHSETLAGQITVRQPDGSVLTNPWELAWDELRASDIVTIDVVARRHLYRLDVDRLGVEQQAVHVEKGGRDGLLQHGVGSRAVCAARHP